LLVEPVIKGIDASAVQGTLDAKSIASAGYAFALLKCQQGNDGKDPVFEKNRKSLTDAGILVGAYHFAYPLPHLDPEAQAEKFFAASDCGTNVGELPVCVDFEWPAPEKWAKWGCNAKQVAVWFKTHLEKMTKLFGHRPVVYTYPWFITALLQGGADLSYLVDYPLWMADYSQAGKQITEGMSPVIPKPWRGRQWCFWQHDGNGGLKLPNGVDADFNVFNGSLEDLQRLAAGKDAYEQWSGPIVHPIIDTSE
jgi:lysozyme